MSRRAWGYVIVIISLGVLLSALTLRGVAPRFDQWLAFAILTGLCIFAHLLKARGPSHEAWHLNLVFLFAGVLLLPAALFVLLVVIPHLVEWAKERITGSSSLRKWYIQPFNIATHIIAGTAARWAMAWLRADLGFTPALSGVLVVALALCVYVVLNHLMVATALVLARGVTWRESGILDIENILSGNRSRGVTKSGGRLTGPISPH